MTGRESRSRPAPRRERVLIMGKTLLAVLAFLTLLEEVISCEYPIVESLVIGGLVLLVVAVWTATRTTPRRGPGAGAHDGPLFFLRRPFRMAAVRLKRTGRTSTPPTLPSSAPR